MEEEGGQSSTYGSGRGGRQSTTTAANGSKDTVLTVDDSDEEMDEEEQSDTLSALSGWEIKDRRARSCRYTLSMVLPPSVDPYAATHERLEEAFFILKEADPKLIIYPWAGSTAKLSPVEDMEQIPKHRNGMSKYVNKLAWKQNGGPIRLELWLGHSKTIQNLRNDSESGLYALEMSLKPQLSQTQRETNIGWLYGSTQFMVADDVAKALRQKTGINMWARWAVITLTDENGEYFHQSKDQLVRALHIFVDLPDAHEAKTKLLQVLSAKSTDPTNGSRFHFLPVLNNLTPKSWRKTCFKWRLRQATFQVKLSTISTTDVISLKKKLGGTTFRERLLQIKRDAYYTQKKGTPGAPRSGQRLFLSIDYQPSTETTIFQFHQRDSDQAHRSLKSLYAFLTESNRSPVALRYKEEITPYFQQKAINFAAEGSWSQEKQTLLTMEDKYMAEMQDVDDDSDYEEDPSVTSRFEVSFDVEALKSDGPTQQDDPSAETNFTSVREDVAKNKARVRAKPGSQITSKNSVPSTSSGTSPGSSVKSTAYSKATSSGKSLLSAASKISTTSMKEISTLKLELTQQSKDLKEIQMASLNEIKGQLASMDQLNDKLNALLKIASTGSNSGGKPP